MQVKIIQQPAQEPVSLSEIKAYVRITHSYDDDLLESMIKSARQLAEEFTNQSFCERTLQVQFNKNELYHELPYGPVGEVTEVVSIRDGDESNPDYRVEGLTDKRVKILSYHISAIDTSENSELKVTYTAGYGISEKTSDLPDIVKDALKEQVMIWYEIKDTWSPVLNHGVLSKLRLIRNNSVL